MQTSHPTVAYITAGAAGMYCGSCMRDNTLVTALLKLGWDVQLIPTYTPIRTDEESVALDRIFFGGINVYLQQKSAFFRCLPLWLDRWIDRPWLIGWLASRGMKTEARELGELTVSMLEGEAGRQRKEVRRLVDWLQKHVRPDLVNFSNILIGGCIPTLKRTIGCKVVVTLQGDDLFLLELPEPSKSQALQLIRHLCRDVDGFIVFSRYYADFMSELLELDSAKIHIVPLGVNTNDVAGPPSRPANRPPTVGYLARICPAKGFHRLVDAFLRLKQMPDTTDARLKVAGWLGESDRPFFDIQRKRIHDANIADSFDYAGVVDRVQKLQFYRDIDVLSVPTTYREPKGIFALEAMANGVPVVLPAHGAFPELVDQTRGGLLFPPDSIEQLIASLHQLLTDQATRERLSAAARESVFRDFTAETMARRTASVYQQLLDATPARCANDGS